MRTIRITLVACLAACSTSAVWAQYGLYGSPETLRLPQQEMSQAYATPGSYPTTATPLPEPAPTPAYASRQPQYRYPAQPSATTTYQPYQPGAQYQYPGPNLRPPMRTASVGQAAPVQPLPAPPELASPSGAAIAAPASGYAPAAPQGSGMMNQMLAEQGGCGGENGCGGAYRGAVGRFEQSACGSGGEGCGDVSCGQGYCCPWYASISALVMNRSDGRSMWTSYKETNPKIQGGNTQIPLEWKWGGEARFGRRFCCGCVPYALEATYWTTEAFTGYRSTSYADSTVNTVLNVDFIRFGAGDASLWFQGAGEQTLTRRDEFHNIEVNLIREQLAWACDSPWDIGWSLGVRYFRFQDDLVYDAIMPGHAPGSTYDAYLRDNITNNLVGAQFGFDAAYNVCNGLRVFITPKVGIYNNWLDSTFSAQLGNHTTNGYNTQYLQYYPVHGTRNALSFLTQIDVGADWQFTRNWSARVGYRVVAATGMGFAEDQFPQYICDVPEIQNVSNPSCLVLHGAFLGAMYNF